VKEGILMKILIIEDEFSLADAIAETLNKENFTTNIITDGEEGENEALTNVYDLILLDIMLPRKNGFKILETLRREKVETPVIILTAKSEMSDKLNGLENGADDYITKPFHMRELVARVKIVLKRKANIDSTSALEYEDLKLDVRTGKMICGENEIAINGKELDLLEILLVNKNQIVNRELLANKIWGYNSDAEYNNVEVYVSFLRKKLKIIKSNVSIKAVRGIGYKLEI
jgi:DNA-binding response OmpR family regulator